MTTLVPTTLSPTTGVPTTIVPTTGPPTTLPPKIAMEGETTWFNCFADNYAGVLFVDTTIGGYILYRTIPVDTLEVFTTISATILRSMRVEELELGVDTFISGQAVTNMARTNWIGWSKIGDVSFAIDRTNDAGFRPMEWTGHVYQILKLGNRAVVYGSGGVSVAIPVNEPLSTFGFSELYNFGVKNKTAIAGDENVHYFIDQKGLLCKVTQEGVQALGFEEFLGPLTNPVLVYDKGERRLYISDGDEGFIVEADTMGGGYANLTGLYRTRGEIKLLSPDIVDLKPIYVVTDVIDFRQRGIKSIENFQLGLDTECVVLAAVDYRYGTNEEFKTTHWSPPNREGVVHLRIAGTDFRIRVRSLRHGTFELSYVNIQYKSIDKRFMRGRQDTPEEVNE